MTIVNDAKEFAQAINDDQEVVVIEGKYKDFILKIYGSGKIVWAIVIGTIGYFYLKLILDYKKDKNPKEIKSLLNIPAYKKGISLLGAETFLAASGIALEGGGISVLNKFRNNY